MNQPATIEDVYRGCYQLTLAELHAHLETIACAGNTPSSDAIIWSIKEMEWDIEHLMTAVDHLDIEGERP